MADANQAPGSAELPFDRLGPYEILKKVGEGGMGAVYLGRHTVLDVQHALKVLPDKLAKDPQFVERFVREARSAAKLTHPHIVSVVGADEWQEMRYLAMHYVDGISLERLVRKEGPLKLHHAVRYAHQTALALDYAHRRGVVHRDVKPDNVLLDDEHTVRLTDFGLVRETQLDDEAANLTQSGTVLGTPYYMSPEQWRGSEVDGGSDVFALGVLLYYLLSRRYPYPGQAPAQILHRLLSGEVVPLADVCKGADEDLCEVVHAAIRPGREARTATAADFAEALRQWWKRNPADTDSQPTSLPARHEVLPSSSANALPELSGAASELEQRPTVVSRRDSTGLPQSSPVAEAAANGEAPSAPPPQALPVQPVTPTNASGTSLGHGTSPSHTGQPSSGPISTVVNSPTALLVWVGLAAAVAILTALAVVVALQLLDEEQGSGPLLELTIPVGDAVEASPMYVNESRLGLSGRVRGDVTLNGEPYQLGRSIELDPGLNRLEVRVATANDSVSRTLYVVYDPEPPELEVPHFAEQREIITDVHEFVLAGNVYNEHSPVRVLVRWDNEEEVLDPDEEGAFQVSVPLADSPLHVRLEARDEAGNRSRVTGRLIPDRQALRVEFAPNRLSSGAAYAGDDSVWFAGEQFELPFSLSKIMGIEVEARHAGNGEPLDTQLSSDGQLELTGELAPGTHRLTLEVRDQIGGQASHELVVRVVPEAPSLADLAVSSEEEGALVSTREEPDSYRLALRGLEHPLVLRGRVVSPGETVVHIDGKELALEEGGHFRHEFRAEAFESEARLSVRAEDPLGRRSERTLTVAVVERLYEALGTNSHGYEEYRRLRDGAVVVRIPAGEYTTGLSEGSVPNAPERDVELSSYVIDKYEVTNAQYAAFLEASEAEWEEALESYLGGPEPGELYTALRHDRRRGWRPADGYEDYPVIGVTWEGARAYARWATNETGDLPSEAQWEVAAGGPEAYQYPWGNERPFPGIANYHGGGHSDLRPVDAFPEGVSPFGLHNMAGNVEEWCLDWYAFDAYRRLEPLDPVQSRAPPGARRARVVRGGSLQTPYEPEFRAPGIDEPSLLYTWARQRRVPTFTSPFLGFRVAGSAKAPGLERQQDADE